MELPCQLSNDTLLAAFFSSRTSAASLPQTQCLLFHVLLNKCKHLKEAEAECCKNRRRGTRSPLFIRVEGKKMLHLLGKMGQLFCSSMSLNELLEGKTPPSTSSFGQPLKLRTFSVASTISFSFACHSYFPLFSFLLSKVSSSILPAAVPPSEPAGPNAEFLLIFVCRGAEVPDCHSQVGLWQPHFPCRRESHTLLFPAACWE